MLNFPKPVFLLIALVKLIVDGAINVRDHTSANFEEISISRMLRIETEGWRDYTVEVCDHPNGKGKLVLKGNVSVTAALRGFATNPEAWEKIIPGRDINVLDYGKLTADQIRFKVHDHGENAQLRIEVFNTIMDEFLANRDMTVVELCLMFNDTLHNAIGGRKVTLTGDLSEDKEAVRKRWAGLVGQNWMPHIYMRKILPVMKDHLAREAAPGDKEAGLFHFVKPEWTALYKAWQVDRDKEELGKKFLNDTGFPPAMAKALDDIMQAREDKEKASRAPGAVNEIKPLTAEKLTEIAAESDSASVKTILGMALGQTVAEFEGLEKALVAAETTEGNPLYDFFNKVVAEAKA